MPVLGCGAEMGKLMDVSDQDVATIEEVIAERIGMGISQAVAQRQAVDEALAQLADERSMVTRAIEEQLGSRDEPAFANKSTAPDWVPQDIWTLHEASRRADDEAEGRVSLRENAAGRVPRPGDLKRNQTMTFRRLNAAVGDYVKGDPQKANDMMVRMNEESGRREADSDTGLPESLTALGVTQDHIDLYNDMRKKRDYVEADSEFATGGEKAAATKAHRKYFNAIGDLGNVGPIHAAISRHADGTPAFANKQTGDDEVDLVTRVWQKIAARETAFRYAKSDSKDLVKVLSEVDPALKVVGADDIKGTKFVKVISTVNPGNTATVMLTGKDIKLDISGWKTGDAGSRIYAAVANWAYNTDRVFQEDDALSENSMFRRTENMMSAALKVGTTRHIAPGKFLLAGNKELGVAPLEWTTGDDAANIRSLIETTHQNVTANIPDLADIRFDLSTGGLVRDESTPVTADEIRAIAAGADARRARAGETSIKRALISKSLLRAADSEGGRRLLRELDQRDAMQSWPADSVDRILYANKAEGESGVLSKDGTFKAWPKYNSWTRAEYNDVISLLPAEYRNDSHRREPIAPEDWDALTAAVLPDLKDLNRLTDKPAFGLDNLGNLVADHRSGLSTNDLLRAAVVAEKHDIGLFVTGVRTFAAKALADAGFVSEFGIGGVLQRAANTNQPPMPMASGVYNNPAYGAMMSYQPRGFAAPMFANKQSPLGFYSALSSAIDGINAKAQPADGWKAQIKGLVAKGSIKADEVEWTGLNDWLDLQTGKVTKEAVVSYLDANGVQVSETTLLDKMKPGQMDSLLWDWAEAQDPSDPVADAINAGKSWDAIRRLMKTNPRPAVAAIMDRYDADPTKYNQYTLPGGENYREVLLTLPTSFDRKSAALESEIRGLGLTQDLGDISPRDLMDAGASKDLVNRFNDAMTGSAEDSYHSAHWGEPNVLAHIRVNDRVDADGSKVLFVEELQSDWGQDGKKKGFVGDLQGDAKEYAELDKQFKDGTLPESKYDRFYALQDTLGGGMQAEANKDGVPRAPFVTKTDGWLNLALKRIISMAVDGGYDKVAFVNGEQSAERYDLSKQVDSVSLAGTDGEYLLTVGLKSGGTQTHPNLDAAGVEAMVGKDIAAKLVAAADARSANSAAMRAALKADNDAEYDRLREARKGLPPEELSGLDLKVGGEGMKAFYDQIVPNATKALLKKLGGGQMERVGIDTQMRQGEFDIYQRPSGDYALRSRINSTDGWSPNGVHPTRQAAEQRMAEIKAAETAQVAKQPGFTITDAMREKVEGGLPLFANKPRPAPLAEETQFQKMRRIWQDQYVHVEAIQNLILKNGGTIGEQQNVYRAEERMHGRAQEKLIDFSRDLLEPMLKKAAKYGVELNELAAYAYAKHAQERNDHIDTINPQMAGAGSGMDDATAANIIQMVQLSGDQAKFDELQQDLMKLTEATRQEYLKSGLISQDDYDAWTDTYKNYVPLRGFENVDAEGNPAPGAGSGLSVKGKETMKALGRRSRAADIIENIVAEHERAVLRGERNTVAKTFLNMAQTNPDPALWEIQPRKVSRSFDKKRNLVVYSQAPDTADSVGAKVAGQQIYIKVKDPLLLQALTNSGRDKKGAMHSTVVEYAGMYTNLLRNTLTRYNPVFGVINAVRDAPMGALATYDALGAEGVKLYAKYYASALVASGKHEANAKNKNSGMDRWLKEMRLAGGTTSGVYMRDVSEIKSEVRTVMLLAGAAPTTLREKLLVRSAPAVKGAKAVGKVLEWMGATSEDAGRLAAYRAAREMGKTPAEAASIAKNLTTNFNRSGEWGPSMNGLYMFFNAGVQGTTKLAQMLANKRVRYVLAGGTAAAMAIALANAANGGDDEDGVPYWDQIPEYEKERNLIIMLQPGLEMDGAEVVGAKGRYIKIPVQYGLNIFMNLGYQMAGMVRNAKDPARGVTPAKAGLNMVSSVFGSINPFGGAVDLTDPISVGMALSPTVVDTAIQQMGGYNGFGRPVGPGKSQYDTKPDSETFSPAQAGSPSQRLASWMNSVTGGNQYRSGAIDVTPGTLDNAVRNLTGGTGTFFTDVFVNLPIKYWAAPEVVAPRDVPFLRSFAGELGGNAAVSRSYEYRAKVAKEAAIADGEKDLEGVEYTPEQLALQSLDTAAKRYTQRMSRLRKEEIEIALDDDTAYRKKLLERRRIAIERAELAKEFNSEFTTAMEAAARDK